MTTGRDQLVLMGVLIAIPVICTLAALILPIVQHMKFILPFVFQMVR